MKSAPPSSVAVLFSGGLDSSILLARLLAEGETVQPIYIASQLCWETDELPHARRFLGAIRTPALRELVVLQMPVRDIYQNHWSITGVGVPDANSPDEAVYLPGRNPLLILKARLWCQLNGIDRLALGSLGSNPFADASDGFFQDFGQLLDRATGSVVEITQPLAQLDKLQVMEFGRELPLELTFSCICPQSGQHCGRCNKCGERQQAFRLLNLEDTTEYASLVAAGKQHR